MGLVTGLDRVTRTFLMIFDLLCLQPVVPVPKLPVTTDLLHCIANPPLRYVSIRDWVVPGT